MYNYNPYYGQQTYTQPRYQPMEPQYMLQQSKGLLGKSVDSVDVVKAIDIPLDGSVSYFPLTDGSAIVTKQLQLDGTSKIMVYKPTMEQREEIKTVSYEEFEELKKELKMVKDRLTLLGGEDNA